MTELRLDLERIFAIDRETMWSLWTDAAHAARWMRPTLTEHGTTRASVDARPGGTYRFEMQSGDTVFATSGTYIDVDPIDRLVYTWQWDGQDEESLVEVTFSEAPGGTRVHIAHTRFDTPESAALHGEGWRGCFDSLASLYEPSSPTA